MARKTHRPPTRMRPAGDGAPCMDVVQSDKEAGTLGGWKRLLESATQEILVVTYWFDSDRHPKPYPVTVRFSGRRVDVKGRLQSGDRFVHDETIEEVVPGSGPISLTARVRGINPGEWVVTTQVLGSATPARGSREQGNATPAAGPLRPAARLWRRWVPSSGSAGPVRTCLTPLALRPGILPGIWGAMVTLGMAVALALQALVISRDHVALGPWWAVTLVAIAVGIVGAKVWYIVLKRREHLINGWCIQGFIASAPVAAVIMLVALHVAVGVFLDVTAPGLLVAMAVGRVGCFFAGCCGGPPTASSFGVWSSDQRVGARRMPAQLLELALAGILGLLVLVAVLRHGPAGGAFFALGLSAYTLGRQGILRLRTERRKTRLGGLVIAALAALLFSLSLSFTWSALALGCLSVLDGLLILLLGMHRP
jgi:phosphatidylglycerol:prolipoprotein diacylglycerol transferase